MRAHPRRSGFSLMELMIVVAVVGVLAAIAIPNFQRYQMRSKISEARTNLKAVVVAEEAYFAERGTYVSASVPVPAAVPGNDQTPWPVGTPGFDRLGWQPDGGVRFQYTVNADDAGRGTGNLRFTAEAGGDLDENGIGSFFGFVRPAAGDATGLPGLLPGTTCVGLGVSIPGTAAALDVVGACDPASGRSEF